MYHWREGMHESLHPAEYIMWSLVRILLTDEKNHFTGIQAENDSCMLRNMRLTDFVMPQPHLYSEEWQSLQLSGTPRDLTQKAAK